MVDDPLYVWSAEVMTFTEVIFVQRMTYQNVLFFVIVCVTENKSCPFVVFSNQ